MIITKEQAAPSLKIHFNENMYRGEVKMEVPAEVARNIARRLYRSNSTFYAHEMMESEAFCNGPVPICDPFDADWWYIWCQHRSIAVDGLAYTEDGKFFIAVWMNFRKPDDLQCLEGTLDYVRVPCDEDILDAAAVMRDLLKLAALPPLAPETPAEWLAFEAPL